MGEFKRGMSPLISALVAEEVQPTGVRPRISVAAGLAYGEAVAVVERSGTRAERAGCKAAVAAGLAVSAEGGA